MDPDTALAICLDETRSVSERHEAGLALQNWLRNGGFPPAVATLMEAGIPSRRRLYPGSRCNLFLARHDGHWSITYTGGPTTMVWRLRKGPDVRRKQAAPAPGEPGPTSGPSGEPDAT